MKSRYLLLSALFAVLLGCSDRAKEEPAPAQTTPEKITPIFHASHEPKKQNAPFSDVVQVGDTYYLAGQIGMDHSVRTLVEGGIEAETRQTLENIKAVLAQHDLEMKDVVKAMVVLDDISDFGAFNKIYTQYFPQKPARTTYAAEALAAGAKIEIEVVAYKQRSE
ncbi:RidA family protein [Aureisphaera galaxeae]|uniref:RidA family protein n=1 Tax=Aureisphaera galaxeae TaxID=1538023 RepID=UPI0023508834|nr:RidA family protein [Aureisphaera galaxeae]MDC8005500.1 RidA family protein [Aureisphaera galaxeae]